MAFESPSFVAFKKSQNREKIHWLVNQVKQYQLTNEVSQPVVMALESLATNAEHTRQWYEAAKWLERIDVRQGCTALPVQERIIQTVALIGLDQLALNWTLSLFLDCGKIPSHFVQNSIFSALRKARRYDDLFLLLQKLGTITKKQMSTEPNQQPTKNSIRYYDDDDMYYPTMAENPHVVSLSAFNTFLASLSDRACSKVEKSSTDYYLCELLDWITTDRAKNEIGIDPDIVSYTIVLQAAAKTGNRTLSDLVWNGLIPADQQQQKSLHAYNARLKILVLPNNNNGGSTDRGRDDALALQLWDEMISNPNLAPDRYTIDLMLLPWERLPQEQNSSTNIIETVLNNFCETEHPKIVSQAFGSFLVRLCRQGSLATARAVFQKFIASQFAIPSDSAHSVIPQTLHFNIMLDGYVQAIPSENYVEDNLVINEMGSSSPQQQKTIPPDVARKEAWSLFRIMQNSPVVPPDSFTYSTMMGICISSPELCHLLHVAIRTSEKQNDKRESFMVTNKAFLRAAITRFGELGDVSSAAWIFLKYGGWHIEQRRLWNVLLGAIVKALEIPNKDSELVHIAEAPIASMLVKEKNVMNEIDPVQNPFTLELEGLNYPQAAQTILSMMNRKAELAPGIRAPTPDSQTYCLVASSIQCLNIEADQALKLFREAEAQGIPADGRFINALVRCFGDNIDQVLQAWKSELRPACLAYESRERRIPRNRAKGKNLLAAYHGLMYCCGRALRPDLAVRIAYAMQKEGLEPNEVSLHSYLAGKNKRPVVDDKPKKNSFLASKIPSLVAPYESVLYVECTKYDKNDKRRSQEQRVRIIV